jgi:hypothetical protein
MRDLRVKPDAQQGRRCREAVAIISSGDNRRPRPALSAWNARRIIKALERRFS